MNKHMLVKLSQQDVEKYIKDDPVRPHITAEWRTQHGREVYALYEDKYAVEHFPSDKVRAIICVAYTNGVAIDEQYMDTHWEDANCAMFYTVWSYDRGAGREIVLRTARSIDEQRSDISRFVTLSPLTEMAEKFHIRNGAVLLDRYDQYQNFEYEICVTI